MMRRGALFPLVLWLGCAPVEDTFEPPDFGWNRMQEQPRYDPYERSDFFEDRRAMREPPEGTVPWHGGEPVRSAPPEVTRGLLTRGRSRFDIFCGACHGADGRGETVVAEHMTLRPAPDLHETRVREHDDTRLYEIVRDGYGIMPGYAAQLDHRDRWAVVHYLRVLQISQRAPVAALPAELREALRDVEGAP
jgi:mono/diheme cytochrome c family protein